MEEKESKAEICEICGKNYSFIRMKVSDESRTVIKRVCKECYYKMKQN